MCKLGDEKMVEREEMWKTGMKNVGVDKIGRPNLVVSRAPMMLWIVRGVTTVLIWTFVIRLLIMGEIMGPKLLKSWPSCFTPTTLYTNEVKLSSVAVLPKDFHPPKSEYCSMLVCSMLVLLALYIGFYNVDIG